MAQLRFISKKKHTQCLSHLFFFLNVFMLNEARAYCFNSMMIDVTILVLLNKWAVYKTIVLKLPSFERVPHRSVLLAVFFASFNCCAHEIINCFQKCFIIQTNYIELSTFFFNAAYTHWWKLRSWLMTNNHHGDCCRRHHHHHHVKRLKSKKKIKCFWRN